MGTEQTFLVTVENLDPKRALSAEDVERALLLPPKGYSLQYVKGHGGHLREPGAPGELLVMPGVAPIAVAVTCHREYLPLLPRQLAAVDAQTVAPAEKLLVLDGCEPPADLPAGWEVIRGDWHSPNPGRNEASLQAKSPWMIFADADDIMTPDYLAAVQAALCQAGPGVGMIYADVQYSSGGARLYTPDAWDYWELRRRNFVSAAAGWRREAILNAGGWPEDTACYDDYSLALAVSAYGYTGQKCRGTIAVDNHQEAGHRRHAKGDGRQVPHVWNHRTYGIGTLLAGRRQHLDAWAEWLTTADLPPLCSLYVLDNSADPEFGRDVLARLQLLRERFTAVHYRRCAERPPAEVEANQYTRHIHVARLYNRLLPMITEDMTVLLEDDTVPPPDGLRQLANAFDPKAKMGGIGAVYLSRINADSGRQRICGSQHPSYWAGHIDLSEVSQDRLYPFRQIAGGFTLFNSGCIRAALPTRFGYTVDGLPTGWDTNLSLAIAAQGYRLFLHGGVFADHRYYLPGV